MLAWLSVLALSVGLAMDATAVAAARGLAVRTLRPRHALACGLWFGGAQALMPLGGALFGHLLGPWIEAWDHWIAFGVLTVLGLKTIHEAFGEGTERLEHEEDQLFSARALLPLAIATSIDALAAGMTLPLFAVPLWASVTTIGVVTALLAAAGVYLGRRFGAALGARLDVAGGVVLIAIGAKVLVEHLTA